MDTQINEGDELVDADISRCSLQVLQIIDYRATSSAGASLCDEKLEMSILYFFDKLKILLLYCSCRESIDKAESLRQAAAQGHIDIGYSAPNTAPGAPHAYHGNKLPPHLYTAIFERMGLGDFNQVQTLSLSLVLLLVLLLFLLSACLTQPTHCVTLILRCWR
jgi:hypothetical protein